MPLTRPERIASQLFLLALFAVSFSTALTNIFVGLAYLTFVLAVATSAPLRALLRQPGLLLPGLLALLLLGLYLLGTSWTIAPHADIATALKKYSRLLILPMVIALAWRDAALPRRALLYCLAGMAVLVVSIYLTSVGMMPRSSLGWWRVSSDTQDAFVFRNHVTIGILLAFASSTALLFASHARAWRSRAPALAAALAAALPIVFLSQGRTGYLVLCAGLFTVFLLRVRLTALRVATALVALALMSAALYATSSNIKERTDAMVNEITHDTVQSPNGLRMSFIEEGWRMFTAHPVAGLGTGGFAQAYAPTALRNWPPGSEMAVARHQPHSEFMLAAVQLGAIGLAVYIAMLASLARAAATPPRGRPGGRGADAADAVDEADAADAADAANAANAAITTTATPATAAAPAISSAAPAAYAFERDVFVVLLTIYVLASTFNSLLWDTTEAHWFLLLAGCLYVAARRRQQVGA